MKAASHPTTAHRTSPARLHAVHRKNFTFYCSLATGFRYMCHYRWWQNVAMTETTAALRSVRFIVSPMTTGISYRKTVPAGTSRVSCSIQNTIKINTLYFTVIQQLQWNLTIQTRDTPRLGCREAAPPSKKDPQNRNLKKTHIFVDKMISKILRDWSFICKYVQKSADDWYIRI